MAGGQDSARVSLQARGPERVVEVEVEREPEPAAVWEVPPARAPVLVREPAADSVVAQDPVRPRGALPAAAYTP